MAKLFFLLGALCLSIATRAADSYGTLLDNHFTPPSKIVTDTPPQSAGGTVADLERALKNRTLKVEMGPPPPPPPDVNHKLFITIIGVASALVALKIAYTASRFDHRREAAAESREEEKIKRTGEEPTVVSLFSELQHGLNPSEADALPEAHAAVCSTEEQKADQAALANDAIQVFESAPNLFSQLRKRFSEISNTGDVPTRLKMLHEFSQEIRPSKTAAKIPALRSHRLLAIALEGMLKQLSTRPQNLTSWRMRLASQTLELLEDLCVPNLTPDLATKPLIRLLVVDDCAVNRRSMVFALKKVFREPDLAEAGGPALVLVKKNAYDAIFLDIEMPGMDGFELCEKIRKTPLNRNTPIVFVTSHDNFESRSKLITKGAQDLIGKPYLPTEIALKALQLSLQVRLNPGPPGLATDKTSDEPNPLPQTPVLTGATNPA